MQKMRKMKKCKNENENENKNYLFSNMSVGGN